MTTALPGRTLPGRTLLGHLPHPTALAGTLERLRGPRAPRFSVLVVLNPTAARALMGAGVADGMRPGTWLLVARIVGDAETVGLGTRGFWQAVELSGGQPEILDRLGTGETVGTAAGSGVSLVGLLEPWTSEAADARVVVLSGSPDDLPALMAAVAETAALVGEVAVRGLPLVGEVWGALPEHPRRDEALAWLRGEAERVGASLRPV